ncbi:MAG: MFS transporter [Halobacteriales archaeon]|nr:MFS transporter [Halobacteriales archaeon]
MSVPEAATAAVRRPRRALATVVALVFIDLVGFGIIIPILPFYVRSFGVSDVAIGLLAASYAGMQFLFAPYLGQLSDRRGRRPVLMLSFLGSAMAWTAFGLSAEVSASLGLVAGLAVLFGSRMLAGAMGGNLSAANAYVADITPPERRAGALGLLAASFSVGFIFGPALGGALASDPAIAAARAVLPDVVPATVFSIPSFAAAALSLLALAGTALFLPEPERARPAGERRRLVGQFVDAFGDPGLRGLVLAFFVVSVAFSGVIVMFIPFVADVYGFDATDAALLLTFVGVLGALNQGVVVGRLARVVSAPRLAMAGGVGLLVALGTLPFAPAVGGWLPAVGGPAWFTGELLALLGVLTLMSVGNGLLNVSLSTLVSLGATEETQGTAFGVTQGAGSLGRTLGPPVMAALYVLARPSPFVVGAVLLVPVLAILAGLARTEWARASTAD